MRILFAMRIFALLLMISLFLYSMGLAEEQKLDSLLKSIQLPPGFSISIYAADVPGARSMALSPSGVLFVGTRTTGSVYALLDRDGDRKVERVVTIAQGLDMPNGVAVRDGDLYVAEVSRILRYRRIEERLENPGKPEVIYDGYPAEKHHGWKFIRFGPDGKLYVPVGAPCNVCLSENPIFSTITRIGRDGGTPEIVAHGVRNTVGFDWHPQTQELWFTDNGRDRMGDDLPPDELNRLSLLGQHFGFPACHGGAIIDPAFGQESDCERYVKPAKNLGPHVAALGMRFYTGAMFPAPYRHQIFIAEHGSWNRSAKIGYRISLVRLQGNSAVSYETFAKGWLQGEKSLGRPVDVEILPDGSMVVSDDLNGTIYRITYLRTS
jgi:glucose/arabinose dehydrogenase